eukprot:CAMPEP_0119327252 /NCGR_PEP_ID=MMETSP1333-20130426/70282_1 /TAXON_ID=418940 /ORGANISM="Scyphosphaera apsteinii, Strain RCC1455" /LENGTH=109 /DNA_ID=CAMNT_0007335787 /DNA_START=23 /DNA_END=348 /DNA_ORIENTATION=+
MGLMLTLLLLSFLHPMFGDSNSAQCKQWAQKGECAKNPQYMLTGCANECKQYEESRRDKSPDCAMWAARGDCDASASTKYKCPTSCEKVLEDQLSPSECKGLQKAGGCR